MRRLLLPAVVLAAAYAATREWGGTVLLESAPPRFFLNAGRVLFAVIFLLAWRFQRGRVAFAVLLVAASSEALRVAGENAEVLRQALAVLLPINLALLGFLRDWQVLTITGALRFGALAAQAAVVLVLDHSKLEKVRLWLAMSLLSPPLDPPEGILPEAAERLAGFAPSLPGTACYALAALALAFQVWRRRAAIEAGLLGTLGASLLALMAEDRATSHFLGVAGLILGLSLIENAFSLAFEDGLTGLPARRALEETLIHLGRTYAIAMVDLDHFKKFNDRHGHEVGDQVLQMVAAQLGRVRGGGKAFRYGGEEFSLVFPGKSAEEAKPFVEELRKKIADSSFTVRSPGRPKKKPKGKGRTTAGVTKSLRVTVSIGLAERDSKNRQPAEVMKAADKALYRSKKAGRNRVTV